MDRKMYYGVYKNGDDDFMMRIADDPEQHKVEEIHNDFFGCFEINEINAVQKIKSCITEVSRLLKVSLLEIDTLHLYRMFNVYQTGRNVCLQRVKGTMVTIR